MRSTARWVDPAWLKAPLLLLRFPVIAVSIVIAAVILGATTAAAPLLLSSAGNAALAQELDRIEERAGISVGVFGFISPQTFHPADDEITEAAAGIPELSPATLTIEATSSNIGNGRGETTQVRFLSRTGAQDHITQLTRDTGEGMWIAESSASALDVRPGDDLFIRFGDLTSRTTVRGIYKDLSSEPISEYWAPLTFHIISPLLNQPPLHPYLIGDVATLLDVAEPVAQQATMTWDFALEAPRLTLPEAKQFARRFDAIRLRAHDPLDDLGHTVNVIDQFGGIEVTSSLHSAIDRSDEAVAAIEGPVHLISLAGRLVALTVLAAAGLFAFTRRRVEARLLSAQGRTPWWQGAKASAEAALPAIVGASLGWVAGIQLVSFLGPSDLIGAGVGADAARSVAWWVGAAIILLGVVFGLSAHQETQLGSSRMRRVVARIPWEAIVLSLAAASLYEVNTRGGAIVEATDQPPKIDLFLLAFPFLFIAGMAGLATRMLRRSLPRLRQASSGGSAWRFLAVRRFAGAQKGGLLLITAAAIALGTLVYSSTLVATTSATIRAKAQVMAGSDLAAVVRDVEEIPSDSVGLPYTHVARSAGDLFPGAIDVDILAIDRATFERGAFWDPSFADQPLDTLLSGLTTQGARLPVIVAGITPPAEATVETRGKNIPVRVIARVEAWPGMKPNRGVMVADAATMSRIATDLGATPSDPFASDEVWIRGDPETGLDRLADAGVVVDRFLSADDIEEEPALRSLSWTLGFLQALGLLAGLIAVVGVTLNLQARQQAREISYALARRMGLSRASHRLAIGGELIAMLATAALSGGVFAIVAARLISSQIDPLAGLPPGGIFQVPLGILWGLPAVLVAISVLGAMWVQRSADRMNVAEVMRLAG